jgi:uncharacterized protein (TIGR02246 family)
VRSFPAFALALACAGPVAASAQPYGPELVVERFLETFHAGDLDAIVSLHAPDASWLPTTGGPRLDGRDAIRRYYHSIFANTRTRSITPSNEHWHPLGDDAAVRSADIRIDQETKDGRAVVTLARLTAVYRRDEAGGWAIVHQHSCQRTAAQ